MESPSDLHPLMNHVFVDFENVHQIDLSVIGDKSVSFMLLVGASQSKLDVALVEKLMERAASVQLVRLTSSGRNALDFALSYYVGRAAVSDPAGYFHIISKDTGFNPLVEHLRSRNIRARRHDDFASLSFSTPSKTLAGPPKVALSPPKPVPAQKPAVTKPAKASASPLKPKLSLAEALEKRLRESPRTRPRSKKKLIHFAQQLGHKATEAEAGAAIEKLRKDAHLEIDAKSAATYHFKS